MTEATQPRMARGTKLPAAILAAALFALLAFAPFASAAADPVGSGTTTVTLNQGFVKSLKNKGVKLQKISPAKVSGKKATFPVTGGSIDPTTGLGTLNLGGGIKFKAGKKSAPVKGLVIDTTKKALTGKVAGKKVKVASISGMTFVRNGFGVNVTVKKLKLTNAAANSLNKKLGTTKPKAFTGNKLMGSSTTESQPATVTVLPGGNTRFAANLATLKKLTDAEVKITPIPPTSVPNLGSFDFPISGGTIAPTATAGVIQSGGGLLLEQELEFPPMSGIPPLVTKITLGGFFVDLSAKTITVEVVATSNAQNSKGEKPLNLGNLGRSSIADLAVGAVVANTTARTVSVQNSVAVLQPISTTVLNGFIETYEGYKQALGTPDPKPHLNSGEQLGTFSFTAQTQ